VSLFGINGRTNRAEVFVLREKRFSGAPRMKIRIVSDQLKVGNAGDDSVGT
jgi:hypothetical protein